jgi:dihydrofolate reductase
LGGAITAVCVAVRLAVREEANYVLSRAAESLRWQAETMAVVMTALSTSLDGYIAGAGDAPDKPLGAGGHELFTWFLAGDTPSRHFGRFRMSKTSADMFDKMADRVGAIVSGRRTYDVSRGWDGSGPMPGVPLFVVTHHPPDDVPAGDPPYTFVTEGVERAIELALVAAAGHDVALMGASIVQQCLRAGLLDEIQIDLAPVMLGGGVRLLDNLGERPPRLEIMRVLDAPHVTHLLYRVVRS